MGRAHYLHVEEALHQADRANLMLFVDSAAADDDGGGGGGGGKRLLSVQEATQAMVRRRLGLDRVAFFVELTSLPA